MIIIAIDPDVTASGIAILNGNNISYKKFTFSEIINEFLNADRSIKIVVEAGYLNKSNWHVKSSHNNRIASQIGNRTGRNHETARKIVEILKDFGYDVIETKPLAKIGKSKDGKISHKELKDKLDRDGIIGLKNTSNQDERDAMLIACAFKKRLSLTK